MPKTIKPPPPKPTSPAPPAVIVPPPPEETTGEFPVVVEQLAATKPLKEAVRELLAAIPTDVSTCSGITPTGLQRYLKARHVVEAVLASE